MSFYADLVPVEQDPSRLRLLPFDLDYRHIGQLGDMKDPNNPPNPPTYVDLVTAGVIAPEADPDLFFDADEVRTAEWLRLRGLHVLSVDRRGGHAERTPDAVIAGLPATLETKTSIASENAILTQVRSGRGQSRRIVVDARKGNIDVGTAQAGLAHALRQYGRQIDEVAIILGNGTGLAWWGAREPRPI